MRKDNNNQLMFLDWSKKFEGFHLYSNGLKYLLIGSILGELPPFKAQSLIVRSPPFWGPFSLTAVIYVIKRVYTVDPVCWTEDPEIEINFVLGQLK